MPDTDLATSDRPMTETLEHLDLRHLPPVDPIERPKRWSQTILRHANSCKRSAYLYQLMHGGMPAHELDRGIALHIAQAKATNLILERHALDASPEGDVDYSVDEGTAKLMLEEALSEHPELTVPLHERDACRMMMSHLARGFPINPATVVGVERKYLLDLGAHTVSAIMDLASIDGAAGSVIDYKSTYAIPSEAEYAATFQGRLYAVALVYGNPVTVLPDGSERAEEPLGSHLQTVTVGECFPRYLQDDGTVPVRSMVLSRIEIDEIRRDIEDQCVQLARAFETGEFPATPSSHCSECPSEPSCPLPRHLRNFAGAIQTEDQAREAAEWHARVVGKVEATRKEIKSFCKVNGPLRFGADQVFEFGEVTRRDTDYEGLEAAAVRAAQYGEPLELERWTRYKLGTAFRARTLSEAELAAEREAS